MRLFRRGRARFSDDAVHERVIVDGTLATLAEPIMHETFVDLEDLVDKMNHYSTQGARQLAARGQDVGTRRSDRARAVGVLPHLRVCAPDFSTAAKASCWRGRRRKARTTATRSSCGCRGSERCRCRSSSPRWRTTPAIATRWCRASCAQTAGRRSICGADEGSEAMTFGPDVTIHPIFRRRHRLMQMLRLLHRLLRGRGASSSPRRARATWRFSRSRRRDASRPTAYSCISTGCASTPGKLRFCRAIVARGNRRS